MRIKAKQIDVDKSKKKNDADKSGFDADKSTKKNDADKSLFDADKSKLMRIKAS
jgi:hypothetical protein